jgi:hypothetical protein
MTDSGILVLFEGSSGSSVVYLRSTFRDKSPITLLPEVLDLSAVQAPRLTDRNPGLLLHFDSTVGFMYLPIKFVIADLKPFIALTLSGISVVPIYFITFLTDVSLIFLLSTLRALKFFPLPVNFPKASSSWLAGTDKHSSPVGLDVEVAGAGVTVRNEFSFLKNSALSQHRFLV